MNDIYPLFEIKNTALTALFIDEGRRGHQYQGVCESGPMDRFAFTMANVLLHQPNRIAIEVFGSGFTLVATTNITIAVTSSGGRLKINGSEEPMWTTHQLLAGDELSLYQDECGYISYIAFAANIHSQNAYQSYSTVTRERAGGLNGDGSPLMVGDRVVGAAKSQEVKTLSSTQQKRLASLVNSVYQQRSIKLLPGSQYNVLQPISWNRLLSSNYEVQRESNRMGVRLAGNAVLESTFSMRSEGVTMGTVQVPSNGQPIILMADRQTLGGYPKIANVALVDLPFLAQCKPGTTVTFTESDINSARNQLRLRERLIQQMRTN